MSGTERFIGEPGHLKSDKMFQPFGFFQGSLKPPIPTSGLRMYFNFEGGGFSGSVVTDFAGFSNGTLNGGTWGTQGGGHMAFDGVNDFIDTNRTANNFGLYYGSASFVFAIRTPTVGSQNFIFHPTNSPSYQSDVNISFESSGIKYSHNTANPPVATITSNTWQHVVCTYNYDNYVTKIYVNGTLITTGSQERMIALDDGYWIGRNTGQYYAFDLGLFMIYNRVISDLEITDVFNNQKGRFGL